MFDVSNQESFLAIKNWLKEINNFVVDTSFFKLLIGNKIDFERAVSKEDAERFARKMNLTYIETSAKEDLGVSVAFKILTELIFKYRPSLRSSHEGKDTGELNPPGPNQGTWKPSRPNKPRKPKPGFFQKMCLCGRDYSRP